MEGKDQHGNCSYDDQVNSITSMLSDRGPQNPMPGILQEPPKEIQFFEIAPPIDLSLELSLGDLYKEIEENPNPNPLSLIATRATAINNVNPPIMTAQNNNGMPPPPPPPQPQPPLPLYYTTDNNNLEISMHLEEQQKRRFDAYGRYILRRITHKRAKEKKKAAATASPPAPPLAAVAVAVAAAAAAQLPQGQSPKPIALPGAVASAAENRGLSRVVEKMNAPGKSSGKKILEGASALPTGIGSSSSQEPWTYHQPNFDVKACATKAVYRKAAIVIENISHNEQIKRPRLFNAVQNNNAHQKK